MPGFVWYYRHDPVVLKALAGGALVGFIIAGLMLWWVAKRKPPLHGAARFAKDSEIRRAGFRANDGIVLGKKGGKFLTFGGNEHCIVEAPTRSGKGVGIVIPNLLSWQERSEEHTSELQSIMRIPSAAFCLQKKKEHENYTFDRTLY